MKDDVRPPKDAPAWRDPLSLSFEAHRGVLLLRLRWHASAANRRTRRGPLGRAERRVKRLRHLGPKR